MFAVRCGVPCPVLPQVRLPAGAHRPQLRGALEGAALARGVSASSQCFCMRSRATDKDGFAPMCVVTLRLVGTRFPARLCPSSPPTPTLPRRPTPHPPASSPSLPAQTPSSSLAATALPEPLHRSASHPQSPSHTHSPIPLTRAQACPGQVQVRTLHQWEPILTHYRTTVHAGPSPSPPSPTPLSDQV